MVVNYSLIPSPKAHSQTQGSFPDPRLIPSPEVHSQTRGSFPDTGGEHCTLYASDAIARRVKSGGEGGEVEGGREEAGGSKDRKWERVRICLIPRPHMRSWE